MRRAVLPCLLLVALLLMLAASLRPAVAPALRLSTSSPSLLAHHLLRWAPTRP